MFADRRNAFQRKELKADAIVFLNDLASCKRLRQGDARVVPYFRIACSGTH
jgi:hypothetical protein